MTETLTGGCLCGAVRYSLDANAEPLYSVICHCQNCKKSSGTHMVNCSMFLKPVRVLCTTRELEGNMLI